MIIFILQLILIHLLGDFVLQPDSWIRKRTKKGIYAKELYYHIGIHTLLLLVTFSSQLNKYILGIALIITSHFIIDLGKIYFEKKYPNFKKTSFIVDQLIHFFILFLVVNQYYPIQINTENINQKLILVVIISIIAVAYISPILLRLFFIKWNKNIKSLNKGSLIHAGKYIGIVERILIVLFININFLEGIGYLLAAKSIFRFGDLTNAKEKKLTEYVVLGTFVSFLLGILIGFGLKIALYYIR